MDNKSRITCIYKITTKHNNKIYIGSAIDFKCRVRVHKYRLNKGNHHSKYLQRVFNKYGIDNLEFEILEVIKYIECIEEFKNKIICREQHYIDLLKPHYNSEKYANSSLGVKRSPETIEKLRKVQLGIKHPEWRNKIKSISQGGKNHWAYGKKMSDETKNKKSETMLQKYKNGFRSPNSKKVKQLTLNGEFIKEWDSTIDAGKQLNINPSGIQNNARGKSKSSGGFIWKY